MNTILSIVISSIAAVIGLVIGNWLALILYAGLLMVVPKRYSTGLVSMYLGRASMGFIVGILFAIMDYFGLNNFILTTIFLFWAMFKSEPPLLLNSAQILSHDILKGDMKKYAYHKTGLKVARITAYFIAKLGLFASFLYFS